MPECEVPGGVGRGVCVKSAYQQPPVTSHQCTQRQPCNVWLAPAPSLPRQAQAPPPRISHLILPPPPISFSPPFFPSFRFHGPACVCRSDPVSTAAPLCRPGHRVSMLMSIIWIAPWLHHRPRLSLPRLVLIHSTHFPVSIVLFLFASLTTTAYLPHTHSSAL